MPPRRLLLRVEIESERKIRFRRVFQRHIVVAFVFVEFRYPRHFVFREREVEYVEIAPDVLGIFGPRDDDVSRLDVPAQDYLRVGLAVFRRQVGKPCCFISVLSP